MATKIQVRRDTSTNWTNLNPVLGAGEIGFETNTGKFKIGNGSSVWSSLDYFLDSSELSAYLTTSSASTIYLTQASASTNYATKTYADNAVLAVIDSAPANLNTLNELAAAIGDDANYSSTVTAALANKLDISTASSTYQTIVANVSDTEIGYLDGVTSSIQTQINNLSSASPAFPGTATTLRLTSTANASPSSTDQAFQIGQNNSGNIKIDTYEILSFNNGANQDLHIQTYGGHVLFGTGVVGGTAAGIQVHGPLRLESSRDAANNTRGIASMQSLIRTNADDNRQELQVYASGDAFSTGSKGAGIHLYGTDDGKHAGNIALLTGTPNNGDARMIIAGGTGTTGYLNAGTTYTRTNTDTRVTIGNSLWDWVDTKQDTGLLNLKDASARPAIYVTSSDTSDGTSYGTIGIETGTNFGVGHWSGSSFTRRFSISSVGTATFAGHVNPSVTSTYDLGTTSLRWRSIYTGDLHLSNGIGDYTIVEGQEDLFLVNNKSGKSFKFALIEVDSSQVPAKAATD